MSRLKSVILKYKGTLTNHLVDISNIIPPFSFFFQPNSFSQSRLNIYQISLK